MSRKNLFLIRSESLGRLVISYTANYKYSRSNRANLPLPVQIKLFKKPSIFCCVFFFFVFSESTLNFQCSEKKKQ